MQELFIFGDHYEIQTNIGICHFVLTKDYPKLMKFVPYLYLEKQDILLNIIDKYRDEFNEVSLLEFIQYFKEPPYDLYNSYKELFQLVFMDDVFDKIQSDEELKGYLELIKEMNCIHYEKPNPNPEIEYYNKLERIMKERSGEVITLKSMITSVGLYTNPFELTIYQLHAWFERISMFKTYNTTTLFKTVDSKMNIIPWYKDEDAKKNNTSLSDSDKEFINNHMGMLPINKNKK